MNDIQAKDHGEYQAARLPIVPEIARDYEVAPRDWRVLTEQIFPAAKSVGSILLALAYCQRRQLDIFKRPVHIVPMWSSEKGEYVETVWPGISEVRTTAVRTGQYAGIDGVVFGQAIKETFTGTVGRDNKKVTKEVEYPEWASVVVYRMVAGQRCAFHAKVFWKETYATIGRSDVPNDMWETRPYGQLAKCVEAAALRMAFPEELGSEYTAEEMQGKTIDLTPQSPQLEAPPAPPPSQEIIPPKPEEPKARQPGKRTAMPYASMAEEQAAAEDEKTVETVFDAAQWLNELDAGMGVCKDQATLDEVWNAEAQPKIEGGLLSRAEQRTADDLFEKHMQRIETAA